MDEALNGNVVKHLGFKLGEEHYAVPILTVREIIWGVLDITPLPRTARSIKGVINLRGKIVPVLDLRAKFGLPQGPASRENCIITLMADGDAGPLLMGVHVDSVTEVLALGADDSAPLPDQHGGGDLSFVRGLAKAKGRVTILLDMDKLLAEGDLQGLETVMKELSAA